VLAPATAERVRGYWAAHLGVDPHAPFAVRGVPGGGVVSVVRLGATTWAIAPEELVDDLTRRTPDELLDVRQLARVVGERALPHGAAHLAYADAASLTGVAAGDVVVGLGPDDPRLRALEAVVAPDEWMESGIDAQLAGRHAVVENDVVLAVAGFKNWDDILGHVCVLTHPEHRGRGHARAVGQAASAAAIDRELVAQWRSEVSNVASAAIAERLGFERLGHQTTVYVTPVPNSREAGR